MNSSFCSGLCARCSWTACPPAARPPARSSCGPRPGPCARPRARAPPGRPFPRCCWATAPDASGRPDRRVSCSRSRPPRTSGRDLGVAQTALGLPLELGILHARPDDGGHALAEVVAARGCCPSPSAPPDGGQSRSSPWYRRLLKPVSWVPPSPRGDVVDIGEHVLRVAVRILDGRPEDHVLPACPRCRSARRGGGSCPSFRYFT